MSLVDYSEKLLRDHVKVKRIFDLSTQLGSEENLNFLKDDEIDEDALQKLKDMGFSDTEKVKQALKLNNMNTVDAINWLLSAQASKANSIEQTRQSIELDEKNEIKTPTFEQAYYDKNEIYDNVPMLVNNFRKFKR